MAFILFLLNELSVFALDYAGYGAKSRYFSAFLLLFLKNGRLPLYQVAESFRPAMASAYKLAQANIAYSRFSFFFKPRYTVFL